MKQGDITCARCMCPGRLPNGRVVQTNKPMELLTDYPVRGVQTFAFHCTGCNGKAYIQKKKDPQTGRMFYQPVRLTGSDEEFRPNAISPFEQVQIPVAYTIGGSSRPTRGSPSHVRTRPATLKAPAISLDPRNPNEQIDPNDYRHPYQVRKRIMGESF